MKILNFSLKIKPAKEKKVKVVNRDFKIKKIKNDNIVIKGLNATIAFYADENKWYAIKKLDDSTTQLYEIHPDCFSCSNVKFVYKLVDGVWICRIRDVDLSNNIYSWLPFKPNIKVEGNVIKENDNNYFYIKKIIK